MGKNIRWESLHIKIDLLLHIVPAGDIVHSRILGKDIIIVNSEKVAKDLFDKHSSNNSDCPYFITNDL